MGGGGRRGRGGASIKRGWREGRSFKRGRGGASIKRGGEGKELQEGRKGGEELQEGKGRGFRRGEEEEVGGQMEYQVLSGSSLP